MKDLQIFCKNQLNELKVIEQSLASSFLGVIYALEFGKYVKIGRTQHPHSRFLTLKQTAEGYGNQSIGRICISVPHTNYIKNETVIHTYFSDFRKAHSELFSISLEQFISEFDSIGIIFEDESEKLSHQASQLYEGLKMTLPAYSYSPSDLPAPEKLAQLIDGVRTIMADEDCTPQGIGKMAKCVFNSFDIPAEFLDTSED